MGLMDELRADLIDIIEQVTNVETGNANLISDTARDRQSNAGWRQPVDDANLIHRANTNLWHTTIQGDIAADRNELLIVQVLEWTREILGVRVKNDDFENVAPGGVKVEKIHATIRRAADGRNLAAEDRHGTDDLVGFFPTGTRQGFVNANGPLSQRRRRRGRSQ